MYKYNYEVTFYIIILPKLFFFMTNKKRSVYMKSIRIYYVNISYNDNEYV